MYLRSVRIAKGLKQRDVASAVGVAVGDLSKWERGLERVPHEKLTALAKVLDVSLIFPPKYLTIIDTHRYPSLRAFLAAMHRP